MATRRANEGDPESLPELPDLELPPPRDPNSAHEVARAPSANPDAAVESSAAAMAPSWSADHRPGELPTSAGQEPSSHVGAPQAADFDDFGLGLERGTSLVPLASGGGGSQASAVEGLDAFDLDDDDELEQGDIRLELADGPSNRNPSGESQRTDVPSLGQSPDRQMLEVTADRLARIAGFAPSPGSLFASPAYAIGVLLRLPTLRRDSGRCEYELTQAELDRDRLLTQIAVRRRALLDEDGRFVSQLDQADELARQLGRLGDELLRLEQDNEARTREQHARIAQARQRLQRAETAEHEVKLLATKAETDLARWEARRKRVEIELRNATQQSTVAESSSEDRATDIGARLASLETSLIQARAAAGEAKQRLRGATATVQQARSELASDERALRQATRSFAKERGARSAAASAEDAAFVRCMGDVMRSALRVVRDLELGENETAALRQADALVADRALAAEEVRRALRSYDREAIWRGLFITALLIAGLFVALAWLMRAESPAEDSDYTVALGSPLGGST